MERVKSNDLTNTRTRISERLNEVASARNYNIQGPFGHWRD